VLALWPNYRLRYSFYLSAQYFIKGALKVPEISTSSGIHND
jgi:hypothetical protein